MLLWNCFTWNFAFSRDLGSLLTTSFCTNDIFNIDCFEPWEWSSMYPLKVQDAYLASATFKEISWISGEKSLYIQRWENRLCRRHKKYVLAERSASSMLSLSNKVKFWFLLPVFCILRFHDNWFHRLSEKLEAKLQENLQK